MFSRSYTVVKTDYISGKFHFTKWGRLRQELKTFGTIIHWAVIYIYKIHTHTQKHTHTALLLSDLYPWRGIRELFFHLILRTLFSICNVLENSCVCFATLVPPSSASPFLFRSGKRRNRMGTESHWIAEYQTQFNSTSDFWVPAFVYQMPWISCRILDVIPTFQKMT